jgi:hypothetical protein
MFARFPGRRPRGAGPAVATCLYVLATLAGPGAHALTEAPRGAVTVEATHSPQCDRLHSETSCPAVGMLGTMPGEGPPVPVVPARRVLPACGVTADRSPLIEILSTRFVRGPPTA